MFEKFQQDSYRNIGCWGILARGANSIPLVLACVILWGLTAPRALGQLPQVLYLPFNEGAGAPTADLAVPGQASTNAMLTNPNSWNVVDPYLGNAAWGPSLAPSTWWDIVNVGSFYATAGSFTLEFALKREPSSPFGATDILSEGLNLRLSLQENFGGEFRMRLGLGSNVVNDFGPPFPLLDWTYVSIVYDAPVNLLFLYFDAILVDVVFPVDIFGLPGLSLTSNGMWQIGGAPHGGFLSWNGSIDEFRVWDVARAPALIRMTSKVELANGVIDVGAGAITSPPRRLNRCQYYSSSEVLSVTVCNPGLTVIPAGSAVPMTVSVDGSVAMTESLVLANDLNPGECVPYTFVGTIDLEQPGSHLVRVTSNFPGDTQPGNDVLELDFQGGGPGVVHEFPWRETFDSDDYPFLSPSVTITPPIGWHQRQGEVNALGIEEEWLFVRAPQFGSAPSAFPSLDWTSHSDVGVYASTGLGAPFRTLESPCIELFGMTKPTLAFYYNHKKHLSSSSGPGQYRVRVHSLTTGVTTLLLSGSAGGPDLWRLFRADLSPWIGQVIELRFRGHGGASSMMSIDDVTIFDESTSLPGQASQPLLATLDINGATNANVQEITSGENGPYHSSNFFPAFLNYHFEGLPLMPVMLLSGDLNPRNATFPGIGQMDMGGPIDPVTGIPGGLTVWGNGFASSAGVDYLFYTDATGLLSLQATMPLFMIPPFPQPLAHRIPFATFQAVMGLPAAPYFALSNAVELLQW